MNEDFELICVCGDHLLSRPTHRKDRVQFYCLGCDVAYELNEIDYDSLEYVKELEEGEECIVNYFTKEIGPIILYSGRNLKYFCPVKIAITVNGLLDTWYGLDIITDPVTLILSLGPRYYGIGLNIKRPWARPKKDGV